MIRGGGGCPIDGLVKEMWDIGDKFVNDPKMKKRFGGEISNIVENVFYDVWSLPIEGLEGAKITKGTLGTFQRRLNKVRIASEKAHLTHKFGSIFYTPSAIAEKNPQLGALMDKLHNTNLNYQGRTDRHNSSFKNILSFMQKQMLVDGYKNTGRTLKQASKEADRLESEIEALSIDVYNNIPGAKNKLVEALKAEDKFYVEGEGKVFNDMLITIEKDYLILSMN